MTETDGWIVVDKWDEFQHYKDRTVPWIKFYAELLHDEEWLGLPPRTRSLLCGIWLLYMSSRCALRALPRRLSGALNQQVTRSDIERLVQAGFITIESRPRLEHVQMATRPTRTRAEEKREEEKPPSPPSGKNPNGRPRRPTEEEVRPMINVVDACQHFIEGQAWDETFDEQAMREEFGRIERGRRTEGTIGNALPGLLEQWKATRQDRYGIKADLKA